MLIALTTIVAWADEVIVKKDLGSGAGHPQFAFPPLPNKIMTAQACTTNVEVWRNMGGPAKNQFGADCYAHAVTELINYETRPKEYSAFHLASRSEGFHGGNVPDTLKVAISAGVCPEVNNLNMSQEYEEVAAYYEKAKAGESRVNLDCKGWMKWRHPFTKEGTDDYKNLFLEHFNEIKNNQKIYDRNGIITKKFDKDEMYAKLKNAFPTLSADVMEEVFYSTNSSAYKNKEKALDNYLKILSDRACPLERLHKPLDATKTIVNFDPLRNDSLSNTNRVMLLNTINNGLNENKPVAVSLFTKGIISSTGDRHAVTVAGRMWDKTTKECVFVLKNSWGSSWEPSGLDAARSLGKGYFSLTESQLTESVYGASYIHFDPK